MRVLVATDAWRPQTNGVVETYRHLARELPALGAELVTLTPDDFRTVPFPAYPEIRLAVPHHAHAARRIAALAPDAIHIATEGPVGWMARRWCRRHGLPFTTSFHTRFPEYLSARIGLPRRISYAWLRHFHNASASTMVATRSLASELAARGFAHIAPWTRGVDTALFRPRPVRLFGPPPVLLYVGRVAMEKSIDAFLALDVPGRKVVVGSGPELDMLRSRFPDALFTGRKVGEELAECYASADIFVFPSRTDTFGIVMLEAMASGLPVAALPVTGPVDVVEEGVTGALDEDLGAAVGRAMRLDRSRVRAAVSRFSWEAAARQFLSNIEAARQRAHDPVGLPAHGAHCRAGGRPTTSQRRIGIAG